MFTGRVEVVDELVVAATIAGVGVTGADLVSVAFH